MAQEKPQPVTPPTITYSPIESRQKLVWSSPTIRSLGQITTQTGQGGTAAEFDAYSDHRK